MKTPLTRRAFLRSASIATAASVAFPHVLRGQNGGSPNDRLNLAFIGVGGRGRSVLHGFPNENRVAFCDVDDERAAESFKEFPDVPRFRDYRRMLDKLGPQIDAVAIAVPDHMHFAIAMTALAHGKHVFLEKPLTHTIWEARQLAARAREAKVATQMGNQGHANEGPRLLKEWIQAGILGDVTEIHSWTNRPTWPQGVQVPDHSKSIPVVPPTLDWDLWLGVAAERPYDPAYLPFNWRGYWDFGTGALGDMGCHIMDGAYWALGLTAPASVEAVSGRANEVSGPTSSIVTYHFAAAAGRPAVKWCWYDGGLKPLRPDFLEDNRHLPDNGSLIIGTRAAVLASTYYESVRLVPESLMREVAPHLPPKTLPRIEGTHFDEWVRACKGGPAAGSNFDYSGPFTETVLLSNLAVRAGRRLEWDAANLRVTNVPAANAFVRTEYRPGFGV
jgi:predicted dehydrogenase